MKYDKNVNNKINNVIKTNDQDVERRKTLSTVANSRMNAILIRGDKIKQKTKIRLYQSLIKSILLYNCGTWALTKQQEQKLDSHHRKQLRKVLNIKYPTRITNAKLYEICNEIPISITILKSRWKLFRHILRRDCNIPAFKAMQFYFSQINQTDRNFKGKERTCVIINY